MPIIPQHVSGRVRDTCTKFLGINKCKIYMLVTCRKCFRINNASFSSTMVIRPEKQPKEKVLGRTFSGTSGTRRRDILGPWPCDVPDKAFMRGAVLHLTMDSRVRPFPPSPKNGPSCSSHRSRWAPDPLAWWVGPPIRQPVKTSFTENPQNYCL